MGNIFGVMCHIWSNNKEENYYDNNEEEDYYDNNLDNITDISNKTTYNEYFLILKYKNDNVTLYKDYTYTSKNINERIFDNNLLEKIKTQGLQIQNNIYVYKNKLYKFNRKNNVDMINDLYNLNIKNILLPKCIYANYQYNQYLEVFDYYKNGDLYNYLFEKKNNLSFEDKNAIFKKILNIIIELHKNDYTHRDIKFENFVVDFDSTGEVQPILIDLDYAMKSYQYLHFRGGTAMYAAPEIMNKYKTSYSFKSTDIWSLGILFYIMIYSEPLWYSPNENDNNFSIYSSFKNSNPDESYWNDIVIYNNQKHHIPEKYSSKIIHILDYCLDINYMNRIDASVILNILNE